MSRHKLILSELLWLNFNVVLRLCFVFLSVHRAVVCDLVNIPHKTLLLSCTYERTSSPDKMLIITGKLTLVREHPSPRHMEAFSLSLMIDYFVRNEDVDGRS